MVIRSEVNVNINLDNNFVWTRDSDHLTVSTNI